MLTTTAGARGSTPPRPPPRSAPGGDRGLAGRLVDQPDRADTPDRGPLGGGEHPQVVLADRPPGAGPPGAAVTDAPWPLDTLAHSPSPARAGPSESRRVDLPPQSSESLLRNSGAVPGHSRGRQEEAHRPPGSAADGILTPTDPVGDRRGAELDQLDPPKAPLDHVADGATGDGEPAPDRDIDPRDHLAANRIPWVSGTASSIWSSSSRV